MSDLNHSYWYKRGSASNLSTTLPNQAVSITKKNKAWGKDCMDTLERIAIRQVRSNQRFIDFYRMIEGKLSMMELSETVPHLKHVAKQLNQADIPTFLKHYDILGIIVNAMVGELEENADKFVVTNTDEIGTNEFIEKQTELSNQFIAQRLENSLKLKLAKKGYNTNLEEMNFDSPEQRDQYIQELEQERANLTPDHINKYLTTDWKTDAILWGEYTLESDRERFFMSELDRTNFVDYLLTGRMFRHPRLGYDFYDTEAWSPINTFFSEDLEIRNVQDKEYVGRLHYFSPSHFVNRYGEHLTLKDKQRILATNGRGESYVDYSDNSSLSFESILEKNFGESVIVPHEDYFDWDFAKSMEYELGIPMGQRTTIGKDGKEVTVPTYLPNRFSISNSHNLARNMTTQDSLRTDLIQVVEAYWVSYRMVGLLSYIDDQGTPVTEIVTEELLNDFIKEKGIKQLKTKTLRELKDNPIEPNTLVWDFIPEVWQGKKARAQGSSLDEDLYFDIRPLDVQMKGNSNVYDVKLPVCGYIGSGMGDLILPYQLGHNIAMNQLYKLLEREIGLFFLFDFQFLPSEFKEWGDTEETLIHVKNFARDTGLFPVDFSKQNTQGYSGASPVFQRQDMSLTEMIQSRFVIADSYKIKALEQIGITPQRLGQPTKYETAEGIQVSQKASFAQTEKYFEQYNSFLKRYYEMHLHVAQQAQASDRDITVYYTKSENQKAYLKFSDPDFPLRHFGILPISNAKKRQELKSFKEYLLNTNTMADDTLAIARLLATDTMSEAMDAAREERKQREQETMAARAHEQKMNQMTLDAAAKAEEDKWYRDEASKERDREVKIETEHIKAHGRASDKDANDLSFDRIDKAKSQALDERQQNMKYDIDSKKLEQSAQKMEEDKSFRQKEYELRVKELQERIAARKSQEYQSEINKN